MKKQEEQSASSCAAATLIAGSLGITVRAVQDRAAKERWPFKEETGRGGQRRLYDISKLPDDVQAAIAPALLQQSTRGGIVSYHPDRGERPGATGPSTAPPRSNLRATHTDLCATHADRSSDAELATLAAIYEAKSQREKEEASARMEIVTGYLHLRTSGVGRAAALETVSVARQVSIATITRYLALVDGKPEHTWLYLLTPRHRGRTTQSDISAEALEILTADYLRPERPASRACIARLRDAATGRDWILPSNRTLERRLDALPRSMKILAREGARALSDTYPAQQRSKAALVALQIVNADGYKHNLWVRFPDGDVVRAKTCFFQDVYSSKLLSSRTDKTEHTDVYRLAFGDLVKRWGIPDAVLLDNTLAAANKTMSGGIRHRFRFKVREEEPDGVFKNLNVQVMWATPRHGQAKPIERAFGVGGVGEYIDKAPEFSGAWTGANTLDKPDYDGKTRAIELADLQRVIERETAAWNARQGRRGAMTHGRSIDAVFEESYKVVPIRRATEEQSRLWLLATEPVRASAKDGAITLDAGRIVGERLANRYWSSELFDYAGQLVAARFDPQRLHDGVHVYTADGRYICFADCDRPAGFNDQLAARERSRARNTFTRNAKAMLQAEVRMDALDAAKALSGDAAPTIPAPTPPRSVVRGEFRKPIEAPIPLSAIDEARLAEIEAGTYRAKTEIRIPSDPYVRFAWHRKLTAAAVCGVAIPAELQGFLESYPSSAECRATAEIFKEFELDVDDYASDLVLEEAADGKRAA